MRTRRRRHDPVARQLADLGVAADAASRLSAGGTLLDLRAGTTLVREGERGTQAFLLLAGRANVLTADGVVTVGPGSVVGELATLDPHRLRNATVVAATDLTVLVFDPSTFRSLARSEGVRPHLVPAR